MRVTKKLQKKIDAWIRDNGACKIDIKEENIFLYNGGLFQDSNEEGSEVWAGDIDSTIRYLRRLKHFLNKNGFNTRRSFEDYLWEKKKNEK